MTENAPRRRLLDLIAGTPSLLASGSRVGGDVETPGPLMLGGTVLGDGNVLLLFVGRSELLEHLVRVVAFFVIARLETLGDQLGIAAGVAPKRGPRFP